MELESILRLFTDIGGILLLIFALYDSLPKVMGLRILSFFIGLLAVIDLLLVLDNALYILGTHGLEGFTSQYLEVGTDPKDGMIQKGAGQGRVYLRPRVPFVNSTSAVQVEIQGNPGSKIVYWPSGGNGIGRQNDAMDFHGVDLQTIRTQALGVGVVVLDEDGRGIAVTEKGSKTLLFREVLGEKGGPVNRVNIRN